MAKTVSGKQSKRVWTDEWIHCMCCSRTGGSEVEYYPPAKGREALTHGTTWVTLGNMLSDQDRLRRAPIMSVHLQEMPRTGKSTETENKWLVARGGVRGGNKAGKDLMGTGSLFRVRNMFWN